MFVSDCLCLYPSLSVSFSLCICLCLFLTLSPAPPSPLVRPIVHIPLHHAALHCTTLSYSVLHRIHTMSFWLSVRDRIGNSTFFMLQFSLSTATTFRSPSTAPTPRTALNVQSIKPLRKDRYIN